jgi:hypothetical protein
LQSSASLSGTQVPLQTPEAQTLGDLQAPQSAVRGLPQLSVPVSGSQFLPWRTQNCASVSGEQLTQVPLWQALPVAHLPQLPPQPSSPQLWTPHDGVQEVHTPLWQALPLAQLPQLPPQPSSPQLWTPHDGVQEVHTPPRQAFPVSHWPQLPSQPSSPQSWVPQARVQETH